MNLGLPVDLMNDDVIAYNLYVNGVFTGVAGAVRQGIAAPIRFKGDFAFAGTIASLRLIPVLETGGEHTNNSEHVDFTIK